MDMNKSSSISSVVRDLCLLMMTICCILLLFQVQLLGAGTGGVRFGGLTRRWTSAATTTCQANLCPGPTSHTTASTTLAPYLPDVSANGYNVADIIAMKLGFRESPPPYLSLLQGPAPNLTGHESSHLWRQLCFRRSWHSRHHYN